jgi:hypothetical protein
MYGRWLAIPVPFRWWIIVSGMRRWKMLLSDCPGNCDMYLQVNSLLTKINFDVAIGLLAKLKKDECITQEYLDDCKDAIVLLEVVGFHPVFVLVFEREDGVRYSDFKRIEVGCMQVPF